MKLFKEDTLKSAKEMKELNPYLRLGQAVFNVTHDRFPKIAFAIAGTDIDCFYEDKNIDAFLNKVEQTVYDTSNARPI